MREKKNHLGTEKSPYLLQHKDNPVHWFAWSPEAFAAAQAENKPIFLSIGYATCYWCHMMETDSFEHNDVAAILNEHFIAIKVDREEHPEIDQFYMEALMALMGRGGWPLSAILTPQGEPFFAGTFFYRESFKDLLRRVSTLWRDDETKLKDMARGLMEHLNSGSALSKKPLEAKILNEALQQFQRRFDATEGGLQGAPKFPQADQWRCLLQVGKRWKEAEALSMVRLTLDKMARGGIFDHIGGGFHRYSTDERWLVPHFEKMLYDNALLARLYLEAYQVTRDDYLAAVARQTLDYVLREMRSSQGAFYTAQDAGAVGQEGVFYVWSYRELQTLLNPEEFTLLSTLYTVSEKGNFEGGHCILAMKEGTPWSAALSPEVLGLKEKLFQIRQKRSAPFTDDKILCSWNALMITALAQVGQLLKEVRYTEAAKKAASFLWEHLFDQDGLWRRYREGEAGLRGTLPDYAFFIEALLMLDDLEAKGPWLAQAKRLQAIQDERLWSASESIYFEAEKDLAARLPQRPHYQEGALPSGLSVSVSNGLRLSEKTLDLSYRKRSELVLQQIIAMAGQSAFAFPRSLMALDIYLGLSCGIDGTAC